MLITRQYWLKFFEIFFSFIFIIGLGQLFPDVGGWEYKFVSNIPKLCAAMAGLIAISSLIAVLWHRSGKGENLHVYFQTAVSFYLAFGISVYGAAKIMETQFQVPASILDRPVSEVDGFWLTWIYFGHSHTMAMMLGAIQIIGAALLLFRYTRLIGVFVLLPVIINIVLINYFYSISPLAFFNVLHYTAMLVFLMLLDFDKLKVAFLSNRGKLHFNWKTVSLNVLRVAIIVLSFLFIYSLKSRRKSPSKMNGVWQVVSIRSGSKIILPADCRDSVWSKIYFEGRNGCIFKYNPDKFQDKDLSGDYEIDKELSLVKVRFSGQVNKPDSLLLKYKFANDSLLNMSGLYQKDSLQLVLKRIE